MRCLSTLKAIFKAVSETTVGVASLPVYHRTCMIMYLWIFGTQAMKRMNIHLVVSQYPTP